MTPALLQANNLTRNFRVGTLFSSRTFRAVDQVSLTMPGDRATILSLVGESGSGKTTFTRIVLRLLQPSAGTVHVNGVDIWQSLSKEAILEFKRTVQPIFQNPYESFNPLRPVRDILRETAVNLDIAKSWRESDDIVADALEKVGLDPKRVGNKYPQAFSGGELQRIAIARALIPNPKLIIADEPVSAVDASLRMQIINLFERLKDELGVSFIYVTHDLSTAYYISDAIAIMYRGRVVEYGPAADVLDNPKHPYTQMLLSAVADIERKWTERITLSAMEIEEYHTEGCRFAGRCPYRMPVCSAKQPDSFPVENRTVACFKCDPDHREPGAESASSAV